MSAAVLALIEATDRHGNVQARLSVTQWPVTVGRALDADLILNDMHVAPQHLRLEPSDSGVVSVQVLDTNNGAVLGNMPQAREARFDWAQGQTLSLGRTHLQLRLADAPIPAELPLPRLPWRSMLWTLLAVTAMLLLSLGEAWFSATELSRYQQALPTTVLGVFVGLASWAGLWALATKLFSAQLQFWRHVRIACVLFMAYAMAEALVDVVAFMFSWEVLARSTHLVGMLVLALGCYRHLLVVAPQRSRGLAWALALVVVLGLPTVLGTQWLKNKRLSPQLYLSQLYPPGWRIAAPVPVAQFLQEAASIEQRLAVRLKDKEAEDGADQSQGDE
jgi:hypothetical protein